MSLYIVKFVNFFKNVVYDKFSHNFLFFLLSWEIILKSSKTKLTMQRSSRCFSWHLSHIFVLWTFSLAFKISFCKITFKHISRFVARMIAIMYVNFFSFLLSIARLSRNISFVAQCSNLVFVFHLSLTFSKRTLFLWLSSSSFYYIVFLFSFIQETLSHQLYCEHSMFCSRLCMSKSII